MIDVRSSLARTQAIAVYNGNNGSQAGKGYRPTPQPQPQKSLAAPYLPLPATLPPGRGTKAPI
jgi:hypothetical protein